MDNSELIHIKLSTKPLSIEEVFQLIKDPSCGGQELFVGTVRNNTQDKEVKKLEFSGYEPMAVKEMEKIASYCLREFDILKIAIHHGLGTMRIGDIPVIIGVSSKHREASQAACKYAIDQLKKTVPIWKKEHFQDGIVWVNAHP